MIKEGARAVHLKAGFCTARSISEPAKIHPNETPESKERKKELTAFEAANDGEPFTGYKIPPGALMYYKHPKHKDLPAFDPRTFSGLFVGWRLDAGCKFRNIRLVLDYEAVRKNATGFGRPIQVHSSELVMMPGGQSKRQQTA